MTRVANRKSSDTDGMSTRIPLLTTPMRASGRYRRAGRDRDHMREAVGVLVQHAVAPFLSAAF